MKTFLLLMVVCIPVYADYTTCITVGTIQSCITTGDDDGR